MAAPRDCSRLSLRAALFLALTLVLVLPACEVPSAVEPAPVATPDESSDLAALRAELDELRRELDPRPTPAATEEPEPTPLPTPEPTAEPHVDRCEFEDGAALVADATVLVLTPTGHGTAFHIGGGEFVTAAHVVDAFTAVTIRHGDIEATAQVVGSDRERDIALLAGFSRLPALEWGDAASLRRGATLGVAGFPVIPGGEVSVKLGSYSRTLTLSSGVVLAETDASVSPGNSGGPLFDACGLVLGVVSAKWVEVGVEGLGWAVAEASAREGIELARTQPPPPTRASVPTRTPRVTSEPAATPVPTPPPTPPPRSGAPTPVSSWLAGDWIGVYDCAQGLTGLLLSIEAEGHTLRATFEFFPIQENPGVASGSYLMVGNVVDGVMVLVGERWIDQPADYLMVGLVASVPEAPTTRLSGFIDHPLCGAFILERFP